MNQKRGANKQLLAHVNEKLLVYQLTLCGDWGYPVHPVTLRLIVEEFLDRWSKIIKFKNNLPGRYNQLRDNEYVF